MRLQRSRRKDSRLVSPNGLPVVCVTRGTKWGNPYRLSDFSECMGEAEQRRNAVKTFREYLLRGRLVPLAEVYAELRGKNLACWCPLDQPCHADVLLEVANG